MLALNQVIFLSSLKQNECDFKPVRFINQASGNITLPCNIQRICSAVSRFVSFSALIMCEEPNNRLDKFVGTMIWEDQSYALDLDNMLLRGCKIRNTDECHGLVIFAGQSASLTDTHSRSRFGVCLCL